MIGSSVGIGKTRLTHKGLFDLNAIYEAMVGYLNSKGYDVTEKENADKSARRGKEITIKINADKKVTHHLEFEAKIVLDTYETITEGALKRGQIVIRIEHGINVDYNKRWQGSKFFDFILYIYNNYIYIGKIREQVDKADAEFNELMDVTKEALGMHA
ncbi:hypothetical protein CL622_00725 [archaeon]|nr:hypothetical protein [archaeon]|tara:strand:- start:1016 stop:1489 length:474 start_codon:yes stop_codon:yes gene_type:complete